jgi:predicted small lipoprotein YifL
LNILKKSTLILTLGICAGMTSLSGCGQKGPLYLPVRPAPLSTAKPAAASLPAAGSASVLEEKTGEPLPAQK